MALEPAPSRLELDERLRAARPLLLDGALGTMLLAAGLEEGAPPERWTLENPAAVIETHRAYVEAGSEAIHTNTFGANPVRLARFGLAERVRDLNRTAVRLARAAAPSYVLGDIGPTGEAFHSAGPREVQEWKTSFRLQAEALLAEGVDGLHIETMLDLREASLALAAVREVSPSIPVLCSLALGPRHGFASIDGYSAGAALSRLAEEGATAVGVNCSPVSSDLRDLLGLLEVPRDHLDAPADTSDKAIVPLLFVAQPSAGHPERRPGGLTNGQDPDRRGGVACTQDPGDFGRDLAEIFSLAPTRLLRIVAVGGCCGTTPSFIAALRQRMEQS